MARDDYLVGDLFKELVFREGIAFADIRVLSKYLGVNVNVLYALLDKGYMTKDLVGFNYVKSKRGGTAKEGISNTKPFVHDGRVFTSQTALCVHYGLNETMFYRKLKQLGSVDKAFDAILQNKKGKDTPVRQFISPRNPFIHQGEVYTSADALAKGIGISYYRLSSAIKEEKSVEKAVDKLLRHSKFLGDTVPVRESKLVRALGNDRFKFGVSPKKPYKFEGQKFTSLTDLAKYLGIKQVTFYNALRGIQDVDATVRYFRGDRKIFRLDAPVMDVLGKTYKDIHEVYDTYGFNKYSFMRPTFKGWSGQMIFNKLLEERLQRFDGDAQIRYEGAVYDDIDTLATSFGLYPFLLRSYLLRKSVSLEKALKLYDEELGFLSLPVIYNGDTYASVSAFCQHYGFDEEAFVREYVRLRGDLLGVLRLEGFGVD